MERRKDLNEHLFETLDRLAAADADTIETEMNKASSIINVSEQILNVARVKLEIINANININDVFSELSNTENGKEIEYFNPDSEKNWLMEDGDSNSNSGLPVHKIHKGGE